LAAAELVEPIVSLLAITQYLSACLANLHVKVGHHNFEFIDLYQQSASFWAPNAPEKEHRSAGGRV
jgi:hypothetical protein